jgi:lysophospholipase L1-like esterase
MNRRIATLLLACTFLCSASGAKIKVLTIGDSTMADYDEVKNSSEDEMRGWGQMLSLFFNSDVTVENAAKNGRSSKSFYYEFWGKLRETLKPGDYVVIQFGHNDEKNIGQDSAPNDRTGRGTAPWGQYQDYLSRYVKESRERGAIPVLATPIVRRMFDAEGKELVAQAKHNLREVLKSENDTLYDYVLAMKDVAKKLNVSLVDMTALTEAAVENLGADKSKELIYCVKDNTHLKALGALMYANLFADDIKRQGILTPYLSYPDGIAQSSQKIDFGSAFVNESSVKALSVSGIDLKSAQKITLSVSAPYSVSLSPNNSFSNKVELEANAGDFYKALYIRFSPTDGNASWKPAALVIDGKKRDILLSGKGISADKNKAFAFEYSSRYGLRSPQQAEIDTHLEGLKYIVDLNDTYITTLNRNWPADVDLNSDRYFEISMKAKRNIYISEISYRVAGVSPEKMQFTVLGSAEKSFSKPDTYSLMETMPPQPKQYSQKVMFKLSKGKTYYLRIYPWCKSGAEGKSIKIDSILFRGYEEK